MIESDRILGSTNPISQIADCASHSLVLGGRLFKSISNEPLIQSDCFWASKLDQGMKITENIFLYLLLHLIGNTVVSDIDGLKSVGNSTRRHVKLREQGHMQNQ